MLIENNLDHMTEEEADEEVERRLREQKPKPGILRLEGCWRSLIEIGKYEDEDKDSENNLNNNNNSNELYYSLRFNLASNRCELGHKLSESESWILAEHCKRYGATGQLCSLTGSLKVPACNLADLTSRVAKVLRQVTGECDICRHQMIVSSEKIEVLKNKRFQALFTGEELNNKKVVIYKDDEFVFSLTIMPNDEEGFERVLKEAERLDNIHGYKSAEEQLEDEHREGCIELGLRDTLYIIRNYCIRSTLNSRYIKAVSSSINSNAFLFGFGGELWKEKENREVIYLIQIIDRGDERAKSYNNGKPSFLSDWMI